MQRGMGGKALTETGRRRIRAAVDLSKWVSMRRRQTWRPDLAAGSYGVSSPRPFRKYPPQPLTITILTNLTRARDLSKVLVYSRAPLIATYPVQCVALAVLVGRSSCVTPTPAREMYQKFWFIRKPH
jgi:hypothetical protein